MAEDVPRGGVAHVVATVGVITVHPLQLYVQLRLGFYDGGWLAGRGQGSLPGAHRHKLVPVPAVVPSEDPLQHHGTVVAAVPRHHRIVLHLP